MNSDERNNYNNQRTLSDSHIPVAKKQILKSLGISAPEWRVDITTPEQDMTEAADLDITNDIDHFMTALRLRNTQYAFRYPNEFTVRREYYAGHKTEYQKIMEGFGDFMFYGFHNFGDIPRWIFLNLDIYRDEHYFDEDTGVYLPKDHLRYEIKNNKDNRNNFISYDLLSFQNRKDLLVDHSPGYFSDLNVMYLPKNDGTRFPSYRLKKERIDGFRF